MSLIDEALKRARMEAAQRAAESEGLPYPAIPRHLGPPRQRPRWLVPTALVVAAIAGLLLGRWLASDEPPLKAAVAAPAAAAAEPGPVAEPPAASPAGELAGAVGAAPPEGRAAPAATDTGAATKTRPGGTAPPPAAPPTAVATARPAPPAAPAPVAGDPTAAAAALVTEPSGGSGQETAAVTDPDSGVLLVLPEPGAAAAAPPPAESYVQQLPLAGGGTIELGGIAWSETGPFALLNGRVVGPGAEVGAFTLESIGPQHVILSGEGRRVRLDLR